MKRLCKPALAFTLASALFSSSHAQQLQIDSSTTAKKEIDACIARFYNLLSYQNSKLDNVNNLPTLFVTDGTLTAVFGVKPLLWTASQFTDFIKNGARQGMTDRTEIEPFEHTDIFGNMAHRLSTYRLQTTTNGKKEERNGINSIQLIRQNGVWLIHSLVWDRERDGLKLPNAYSGQ